MGIVDSINDMRKQGIPISFIAGTLNLSRGEVENHINSLSYGDGLSARIEAKIDVLVDSIEDKVCSARLGEVIGGIKVLNDIKRLEEGKSTENIDIHLNIREAIKEQVRKRREFIGEV